MKVTLAFIGALLFLPAVSAQSPAPAKPEAARAWSVPRTPWGDPDLQGLWPSIDMQGTPYERPENFGARAVLNGDEVKARETQSQRQAEVDAETTVNTER